MFSSFAVVAAVSGAEVPVRPAVGGMVLAGVVAALFLSAALLVLWLLLGGLEVAITFWCCEDL